MSKKSGKEYIEVQKGPVSVKDQYNIGFEREPEMTRTDLENMALRRSGQILTKHEPRR
jgi:hypothetical protein